MMASKRLLPDKPKEFICRCIKERKIQWTYHVNMRMRGRFISREAILEAVDSYEVIEAYPEDKYFPSYLVCARRLDVVFHVLFAVDVPGDSVRVVTAYPPDPEEWETDLTTRRRGS
ncbi:MAG: DUF4258 domain-containing protein [Armatimonadetes bacterium]|nr:DUF4258 domain-containing protein [Armatimonadota bacterium]